VATLHQGDSFGELALIDSRKGTRSARIIAGGMGYGGNP
jgi:CRP-like cAMP-binding protein